MPRRTQPSKALQAHRILGLADGMTAGAALLEGTRVQAVVSEERLTRQKMAIGFPGAAVAEVLRMRGLAPADIGLLMVATREGYFRGQSQAYPGWFPRGGEGVPRRKSLVLKAASSKLSYPLLRSRLGRRAAYKIRAALLAGRRAKLKRLLREKWGFTCPIRFVNHHYAHATSAYYTAGHRDALVITLDGAGDGDSSHVYAVRDGDFRLLQRVDSFDSIGNYYGYVTHVCGFTAHKHEGKITGLAAFGTPRYAEQLRALIGCRTGRIVNAGGVFSTNAVRRIKALLPDDSYRADLASSMQCVLEQTVTRYGAHWLAQSGLTNLVLAGGVFANVRLNQALHELAAVESLFVHPGMGDEGLALGAALAGWRESAQGAGARFRWPPLRDVYLGPDFSPDEIAEVLAKEGLPYQHCDDVATAVAELLAKGLVVARFDGRMEYGPRALGNRSILYQASDPSVNDWLNRSLERTEFMPFAPVTRFEDGRRLYHGVQGAEHTAEFMTITFDCSDELKRACPAVVHVDGTARPQLLRSETNPEYYRILDEYIRLTGIPAIINTSFNMHEEPIVCTPADAVRAFLRGHLDALSIGPFIVRGPQRLRRATARQEALRA